MSVPALIELCCEKYGWVEPHQHNSTWYATPPYQTQPKRIPFGLFDNDMAIKALEIENQRRRESIPDEIVCYCQENGWTEPQFVNNQWWAFPPNAVMPLRIVNSSSQDQDLMMAAFEPPQPVAA